METLVFLVGYCSGILNGPQGLCTRVRHNFWGNFVGSGGWGLSGYPKVPNRIGHYQISVSIGGCYWKEIVKPGSGRGNFVRGVFREGPKEIEVFSRRAKNNLMACRRASLGRRARLGDGVVLVERERKN